MLKAVLVVVIALVGVQSQPPTKTPSEVRSEQQQKSPQSPSQTETNNKIAPTAPPSVDQGVPNPTTGAERQGDSNPSDHQPSDYNVTNGLIALFTGVLTVVAIRQFRIIRRQADYMREGLDETKIAANAAKTSAERAGDAVRHAKTALDASIEASRLDQRAWVGPRGIRMNRPEVGKPLIIAIDVANSGKTPALTVQINAVRHPSPIAIDPAAFMASGAVTFDDPEPSSSTLFPNVTPGGTKIIHPAMLAEDVHAINSGAIRIYVIGRIHYEDIFRKPHMTTFAYEWDRISGDMNACATYNDAE